MTRIVLTGGIASGKSTVAGMFAERGALIVDADAVAHDLQRPGEPVFDAIVRRFGASVVAADGTLDRASLGSIVFTDPDALADLNAIVHPAVRRRCEELVASAGPKRIAIQMIPLLVEAVGADRFDEVIVVDVDEQTQLRRLMARNGLSEDAARARIAAQASRAERLAVATHVIDNSGQPADLVQQVDRVWADLVGAPRPR